MMRAFPLLLCAALVLAGCSTITIGEEDVLYPKPSVTPQTFDLKGVTLTNRFFSVDDTVEVNAWHLTKPDAETTVLFFGGNGFYLVQSRGYLRALTRPSTNAVLWDYRGYGRSGGAPNVETLRHDALAVYDTLVQSDTIDAERLLVWGHSMGSFLATHVAMNRDVAGVVLENPVTTADDWVDHLIPWYVRLFVGIDVAPVLREEDNLARVRRLKRPLLIIAGSQDTVTDAEMARRLHDEAVSSAKGLVIVEEGGHNGLYEEPRVQTAYRTLVQQILASSASERTPLNSP